MAGPRRSPNPTPREPRLSTFPSLRMLSVLQYRRRLLSGMRSRLNEFRDRQPAYAFPLVLLRRLTIWRRPRSLPELRSYPDRHWHSRFVDSLDRTRSDLRLGQYRPTSE